MSVYASPEISSLDSATVFVEESPENAERPAPDRVCIVTIRRDGRQATRLYLGPVAAHALAEALAECFKPAPGAVTKAGR